MNNTNVTPAGDYNFGVQGANCMSASGTTSGSAVVITGCGGTPAQAWAATLVSTAPNSLHLQQPGPLPYCRLTSSGNDVFVDTCNGSSSQKWGLTAVTWTPLPPPQGPITNGGYTLIPQNATGLMLDDSNSGTGAGNPIDVTTPASSVAQNWALSDNGVTPLTYYNFAAIGKADCMNAFRNHQRFVSATGTMRRPFGAGLGSGAGGKYQLLHHSVQPTRAFALPPAGRAREALLWWMPATAAAASNGRLVRLPFPHPHPRRHPANATALPA